MSEHKYKKKQNYNYSDYLSWPEDERWEIIEGDAYNMSPSPSVAHQRISRRLFRTIDNFLENKKCEAFYAPIDVIFSNPDENKDNIKNVVQPDIVVVCDPDKIDKNGCNGSPDFIIEILSPATAYKDETFKLNLYEKYMVKEYWIVNPDLKQIAVYKLGSSKKYNNPVFFRENEEIIIDILGNCKVQLKKVLF